MLSYLCCMIPCMFLGACCSRCRRRGSRHHEDDDDARNAVHVDDGGVGMIMLPDELDIDLDDSVSDE
jgi:hypothetical protein